MVVLTTLVALVALVALVTLVDQFIILLPASCDRYAPAPRVIRVIRVIRVGFNDV